MAEFPLDLYPPADFTREDILRQIFGEVGDLCHDFSCAVETKVLLHGRMYVTNRFLCFYSNLFGVEKKIRIPYSHITLITKENTALVIPNAIAIATSRKEYLFRSFWDRDECYRTLLEFTDKYKAMDSPSDLHCISSPTRYSLTPRERERDVTHAPVKDVGRESAGRSERSGSLSSTNSIGSFNTRDPRPNKKDNDPSSSASASASASGRSSTGELKGILRRRTLPAATPPTGSTRSPIGGSASLTPTNSRHLGSNNSLRSLSVDVNSSSPPFISIPAALPPFSPRVSLCTTPPSPLSIGSSPPDPSRLDLASEICNETPFRITESEDEGVSSGANSIFKELSKSADKLANNGSTVQITVIPTPIEVFTVSELDAFENDFNEEVKNTRLKHIVISSQYLAVSVCQFAAMFIDDDAPHDLKSYHEVVKDFSVNMSAWSNSPPPPSNNSSNAATPAPNDTGMRREIRFQKVLNKCGLKSTRGVKAQRYVRYGHVGLLVCSSTRLEDVPAAETFLVEDAISVRADGEGVRVEISFEVKFVRSTMLRMVIEGNTKSDMTKWLKDYYSDIERHCSSFLGRRGSKSLSPYSAVSASPTARLSGSGGVTTRKKSARSLMSVSNDSEGHNGHLSMHTNTSHKQLSEKGGARSPVKRVQHSVVAHCVEEEDNKGKNKWSWALSLSAFIIGLVLCLHIDRTHRQWKLVSQKLDTIESLLQDLREQSQYVSRRGI